MHMRSSALLAGGLSLWGRCYHDVRARKKHHLAVGDDGFTRIDALVDDCLAADCTADRYQARFDRTILFHDVDELAALSGLDGLGGDDGRVLGSEDEHDIDKLPGPQHAVAVVEGGLEMDGAGLVVHGVIDQAQVAGCFHTRGATRRYVHVEPPPCARASN